jgi:hypothetical protein
VKLAQPGLNGQGSQGNEHKPLYGIGDQAYGGNGSTYRAGGYHHDSWNIEGGFCDC